MIKGLLRAMALNVSAAIPGFDNEGLFPGTSITPAQTEFSIAFRHDMDCISSATMMGKFLEKDALTGVRSTLFMLLGDAVEYPAVLREAQRNGYDIQLHSEARPDLILSVPKLIPPEVWICWRYASNLARQKKRLEDLIGHEVYGHCPHAQHNYLYFNNYMNWNLIEKASMKVGFSYLSDWRLPARTPEGQTFPEPLPPYIHSDATGDSCLIVPTGWDDKYFFSSFEDKHILKVRSDFTSGHSLEVAFNDLMTQVKICKARDIPLVINLHPIHMLNTSLPVMSFKQKVCDWALTNDVKIRTVSELQEL